MYCGNCGKPRDNVSDKCKYCGSPTYRSSLPKPKSNNWIYWVIAIIFGCILLFNNAHTDNYSITPHPYITIQTILPPTQYKTMAIQTNHSYNNFKYIDNGYRKYMNYEVFQNVSDYLYREDTILYVGKSNELYYKLLNDDIQDKFMQQFIQNINDKSIIDKDKILMAVSIVQNIKYKEKADGHKFFYPYTTLYEKYGVCSDKSILLVYLLKNMGYNTSLIYFDKERHMAVGIRTLDKYSYNHSGYAFIETTQPSIITNSYETYDDIKLESAPIFYMFNSGGKGINDLSEEYNDAIMYNRLVEIEGDLLPKEYGEWEYLVYKYGIILENDKTIDFDPRNDDNVIIPVQTLVYYNNYYDYYDSQSTNCDDMCSGNKGGYTNCMDDCKKRYYTNHPEFGY